MVINFHLLVVLQSCNLQTSMSELGVGILTAPCKKKAGPGDTRHASILYYISLVPRPSIMRREGLVSIACACASILQNLQNPNTYGYCGPVHLRTILRKSIRKSSACACSRYRAFPPHNWRPGDEANIICDLLWEKGPLILRPSIIVILVHNMLDVLYNVV